MAYLLIHMESARDFVKDPMELNDWESIPLEKFQHLAKVCGQIYNTDEDFQDAFNSELFTNKDYQLVVVKTYPIKEILTGNVSYWTVKEIMDYINADRSNNWSDYDITDWREGWDEWCEGDSYNLLKD